MIVLSDYLCKFDANTNSKSRSTMEHISNKKRKRGSNKKKKDAKKKKRADCKVASSSASVEQVYLLFFQRRQRGQMTIYNIAMQ